MGLVESLTGRWRDQKSEAGQTLRRLAQAEASGAKPGKGDGETLERALNTAGATLSEFRELVELYRRRLELLARIANKAKYQGEAEKAAKEAEKARANYQKVTEQHLSELYRITNEMQNAEVMLASIERAEAKLTALEDEYREAFGIPVPDYDRFRLRSGGEDLSDQDPDAPELLVSAAVFQREKHRRRQLVSAADAQGRERYRQQLARRAERLSILPRLFASKAAPAYTPVTWKDIVEGKTPTFDEVEHVERADEAAVPKRQLHPTTESDGADVVMTIAAPQVPDEDMGPVGPEKAGVK